MSNIIKVSILIQNHVFLNLTEQRQNTEKLKIIGDSPELKLSFFFIN